RHARRKRHGRAGEGDVVLDRHRETLERAGFAAAEAFLTVTGLRPGLVGEEQHEGVELRVESLDPLQAVVQELHRRQLATLHEVAQLGGAEESEFAARLHRQTPVMACPAGFWRSRRATRSPRTARAWMRTAISPHGDQ